MPGRGRDGRVLIHVPLVTAASGRSRPLLEMYLSGCLRRSFWHEVAWLAILPMTMGNQFRDRDKAFRKSDGACAGVPDEALRAALADAAAVRLARHTAGSTRRTCSAQVQRSVQRSLQRALQSRWRL